MDTVENLKRQLDIMYKSTEVYQAHLDRIGQDYDAVKAELDATKADIEKFKGLAEAAERKLEAVKAAAMEAMNKSSKYIENVQKTYIPPDIANGLFRDLVRLMPDEDILIIDGRIQIILGEINDAKYSMGIKKKTGENSEVYYKLYLIYGETCVHIEDKGYECDGKPVPDLLHIVTEIADLKDYLPQFIVENELRPTNPEPQNLGLSELLSQLIQHGQIYRIQ